MNGEAAQGVMEMDGASVFRSNRVIPWMLGRLKRIGGHLRFPVSLRTRILLFSVVLVALTVLQGTIGWGVADRNQHMDATADQAVTASVADTDLLRTLKNMQVYTLVTQTLVAGVATDEPVNVKLDLKKVAHDYYAAQAELARITTERHMTTLGSISDVPNRVDIAKKSFDELEAKAIEAVDAAAKSGGNAPADMTLQISARVDGLYEHLDRLAEGTGLLVSHDKAALRQTLASNTHIMRTLSRIMAGAAAVGFVVCIAIALFLWRGILHPLTAVARATRLLGEGDLHVFIPHFKAAEIAEMTRALAIFRGNLIETGRLREEQDAQVRRTEQERRQSLKNLADAFEADVDSVAQAVTLAATELEGSARHMSQAVEDSGAKAAIVVDAAEHAASNVRSVASAAEELAASIGEITGQTEKSGRITREASVEVEKVSRLVHRLSENVASISDITQLISDIASRTNLLALNATIEAARAGDAGKGFAVVAGEVKQLANQTAKATGEISTKIAAVMDGTTEAVNAIDSVVAVIGEMGGVSAAVTVAVEQQTAATAKIASNVDRASTATSAVFQTIGGMRDAARETGAATEQINAAATDLSRQAGILRQQLTRFLSQVRADAA
jgi:methyl-accepting chemotaxis protein